MGIEARIFFWEERRQIVELCINKKRGDKGDKEGEESEAMTKAKAQKMLRPHYEILLALSCL